MSDEANADLIAVRILHDWDEEFAGADGRAYPPMKTGDILTIPKINARIFRNQNIVEIIEPDAETTSDDQPDVPSEAQSQTPPTVDEEARKLWESGEFPEFVIDVFSKRWCGDIHIFRWVLAAFANGFVENSDEGLHIYVSGASGLGKSDSVKAALKLLPQSHVKAGQYSRKALLYTAGLFSEGTVVFRDDHVLNEDEAGIFRAILASWRERSLYTTVDKLAPKIIEIPPRITQITTSVDGLANDDSEGQNESRFITIEIRRTPEQLHQIIEFIKNPPPPTNERVLQIIGLVWGIIVEQRRSVEIPFLNEIEVEESAISKFREFKKFLSLIRSLALLHGRTIATYEDFEEAQHLWSYILVMIDNEIPGLSKNEEIVFAKIRELSQGGKRVELSALRKALPRLQDESVYRAFRGKGGSFSNPRGGLLCKIRGLSLIKKYDRDSGESDRIIELSQQIGVSGCGGQYTIRIHPKVSECE